MKAEPNEKAGITQRRCASRLASARLPTTDSGMTHAAAAAHLRQAQAVGKPRLTRSSVVEGCVHRSQRLDIATSQSRHLPAL
jgi:hypothetical protein